MKKVEVILADDEKILWTIYAIRKEVFVEEQEVDARDEFDKFEHTSRHFLGLVENVPSGTVRWRVTDKGCKLERCAVLPSARRLGVGSALMTAALEDIEKHQGKGQYLYLHSQLGAMPLYEKFGFVKVGEQFEECNIQHFKMERTL
jgi:predicted GNAT family N-acyltransferase